MSEVHDPTVAHEWVDLIVTMSPEHERTLYKIVLKSARSIIEYTSRQVVVIEGVAQNEIALWKIRFPSEETWRFDGDQTIYFLDEGSFQDAKNFTDCLRDHAAVSRRAIAKVSLSKKEDLAIVAQLLRPHRQHFAFPEGTPEELLLKM